MIVDDDATIRRIAEISLTRIGKWNVKTAESGIKALALLESFSPDLIMLDVMMPDMDGPSTFRRIKILPQFSLTPIIFMTAKVQKHELQSYCDSGISGVVVKPFDPVSLPSEIKAIYEKAMAKACVA